MQTLLTLTVQKTIDSKDEKDYEEKRDLLIKQLECLRLTVDIESEDEAVDLIETEDGWGLKE